MEIIRTENIEKIYSDNGIPVKALADISLSVNSGDFSVLAGPSGSGKTTLLNIIGSLDTPTQGKVFLDNVDLSTKTKTQLSDIRLYNIGFVFQAYNLIPVLSAIENIEFAMMLAGISQKERNEKAFKVMEELEIADLVKKRPNQMSGGQQQRVAVARAIANDPFIVLADEPTANLDSKTGGRLLDLMQKMNEEKGITFIFSSHDRQVIERAKILYKIRDGLIEETVRSQTFGR